jgi:hypothetical protein
MKGCEKQIIEYCAKDFNQGKENTTLIYDDGFVNISIPVNNTLKEYNFLTPQVIDDKISTYDNVKNNESLEHPVLE